MKKCKLCEKRKLQQRLATKKYRRKLKRAGFTGLRDLAKSYARKKSTLKRVRN